MQNKINREQIIHTTLQLINQKEEIRYVNLREIARLMGCSHTNLYNYFNSLEDILWASVEQALIKLNEYVNCNIQDMETYEEQLDYYFSRIIEFYLKNKGWFRLIWFEKLNGQRPKETLDAVIYTVNSMIDIFYPPYRNKLTKDEMHYILHNVHCYLHGEIFIYISGRGLIKDEIRFKKYVNCQCIKLMGLYTA